MVSRNPLQMPSTLKSPLTQGTPEELRTQTDESLAVRARDAGDVAAFRLLVERYTPELSRFISLKVSNPSSVEDVLQDTFLKVSRSLGSFDESRRFKSWIYAIASNTAVDLSRQNSRRREVQFSNLGIGETDQNEAVTPPRELAFPAPQSSASNLEALEIRAKLFGLFDQLPEQLRSVVLLDFSGLTYQQISNELGLPLGTVKSRLFGARQILKELIRRECPELFANPHDN